MSSIKRDVKKKVSPLTGRREDFCLEIQPTACECAPRFTSGRQLRFGQKGGGAVGKTKRGKGTKWMVLGDGEGVLLGVRLESVSPAEVTLADATLKEVRVPRPKGRPRQKPKRVIADRGYDSDPLRQR
jgi:hypothetical protein